MRNHRSKKIALLCAVLALGYFGIRIFQRDPDPRVNGAVLVCDDPTHDFGTVWSDARLRHTFRIRNVGNETGWFKVLVGCSCWYRRFPIRIDPGETIYFPVEQRTKMIRGRFKRSITLYAVAPPTGPVCPNCLDAYDSPRHVARCGVPSIIRQQAKVTDGVVFAIRTLLRHF